MYSVVSFTVSIVLCFCTALGYCYSQTRRGSPFSKHVWLSLGLMGVMHLPQQGGGFSCWVYFGFFLKTANVSTSWLMDSDVPVRNSHMNLGIIIAGDQLREQEQRCSFWKRADSPVSTKHLFLQSSAECRRLACRRGGQHCAHQGWHRCVCQILKRVALRETPWGSSGSPLTEGQVRQLSMVA